MAIPEAHSWPVAPQAQHCPVKIKKATEAPPTITAGKRISRTEQLPWTTKQSCERISHYSNVAICKAVASYAAVKSAFAPCPDQHPAQTALMLGNLRAITVGKIADNGVPPALLNLVHALPTLCEPPYRSDVAVRVSASEAAEPE